MKTKFELIEQNYRYLFENASDAMWVHDIDGNIVDANKADERLSGYTREELIGMNVTRFLTGESLTVAREVRRRLLVGEDVEQPYEQELLGKDGAIRIVKMATSLVIIDGEVKGFQHVARDVTEERRLQENIRFYVQQITRAQEDERKRIARELHDDVAPSLLLLIQRLDTITLRTRPKLSESLKENLENLRSQGVEVLESLRRYAQNLRPGILDDLGLVAALEWMTEEIEKDYGIKAGVEVIGIEQSLPAEVQLLLFRIAQEALSNTRRHAGASVAMVRLEFERNKVRMTLTDNGKGFKLPSQAEDLASTGRLGIIGMYERARLAGGTLNIHSELGKGTQVIAEIPLSE